MWLYRQRYGITSSISNTYFSLRAYKRKLNLKWNVHAHSVSCCFLFTAFALSRRLLHSDSLPALTCQEAASLFLCPFVGVSRSHLYLASHRDQRSRAALSHHEGRAAQVPPRKLWCLQIRHQSPEQVRLITLQLLHFLHAIAVLSGYSFIYVFPLLVLVCLFIQCIFCNRFFHVRISVYTPSFLFSSNECAVKVIVWK